MLGTLLKIGEWQSQGKNEWDRFLDYQKVVKEDRNGNPIKNYTLPIIFDLDEMKVIIEGIYLKDYDEKNVKDLKAFKIKGGNNKAIYATVPSKKIIQIFKTFFGKEGGETNQGEIVEAIQKLDKSLLTDQFKEILSTIFKLKNEFIEVSSKKNDKTGKLEINLKAIEEKLEFGRFEKLILLSVFVKSKKYGFNIPVPFCEIEGYKNFISKSFLGDNNKEKRNGPMKTKLCYASGNVEENVGELELSTRYSLNKMFVTETRNYATLFNKKKFSSNYQVSIENQEKLDYASDFLLNEGNYKVKIANIDHVIIPQFRYRTNIDWDMVLNGIKKKSDLLFNFRTLENMNKDILDETENVYWINFVAFESDGNFFKSTEIIKDVSNFHFSNVVKTFVDIDWEMKEAIFIDWDAVMTEYRERRFFNLNTVYALIPLRKDKEKKNKALDLFKSILENRPIEKNKIYDYFTELILCHWYERYGSYTNIQKSSKDYFNNSVRESVFKYHAFIQVLKHLKLIDMEEKNNTISGELHGNKYDNAIHDFFERMKLNQDQQAMFYLGRMLNTVEYIQKGKNKTVIQKVNFNGMDKDDIQRLRIGLIEKAKQYNSIGKVVFTDNKFSELFNFNSWDMNPKESVFFLLTGYSFGIGKKDADELTEKESIETIN
jgi:CRISPR-associated protein Csh1